MIQKTYILDTNVYGELLIETDSLKIIEMIKQDKTTYVYGIDVVENELKNAPAEVRHKGAMLREAVLIIYKTIVDEQFKLFPLAEYIASKYYEKFDELRASGKYYKLVDSKTKKYSEDDLRVDFQIIAVASLKGVDIVVSTDKRTILSRLAEDTYNFVNDANGLRTPNLVKYSEFKKRYIK